jgi:hypothetical protein
MNCSRRALAYLATPLLCGFLAYAGDGAPPNFSGSWQLDPAKSKGATEGMITLNIQDTAGKISLERLAKDKDGKELTSKFACAPAGPDCDFDEYGNKSKVSLWYSGAALNILKTNGPKEDATTQWKVELSPDKKTMTIHVEHLEPADKDQDLVFVKTTS